MPKPWLLLKETVSLIKAHRPLRWSTALHLGTHHSILPFHCDTFLCISFVFFCPGTRHFPSAAAVIGFHVNWDGSGDRQITSACFTSYSQTHKYRCIQMHTHTCKQRDSLSPQAHTRRHTHPRTHTYQSTIRLLPWSLPNEGWDDSWNADIIMHHSRGPGKLFHLKREKSSWLLCVWERQLNGPKSALQ